MSKRVSVLGSGWLGLPLIKALVAEGYTVKASAKSAGTFQKLQKVNCEPFFIDVEFLDGNSSFFNCDYLIFTIPPSSYPVNYQQQLAKIIKLLKKKKACVVFTSSVSVYGNPPSLVNENSSLMPYSLSSKKVMKTERLIIDSGVDHIILRMGGLVGNKRHPVKYLAGKKELSGAKHPVNLLHLNEAISIIHHCIYNDLINQIFNCCSSVHPTKKEFYTYIAKKVGLEIPIFDDKDISEGKKVSTEKLIKTNYKYLHPDPLLYFFL